MNDTPGMLIQINTAHSIEGSEGLNEHCRSVVQTTLGHFTSQLTRVEVHVSDENGAKIGGDDKRCVMEARLEGLSPAAVTHHAGSVHDAVRGAAEKLAHVIGHTLGRLHDPRGRRAETVALVPPLSAQS